MKALFLGFFWVFASVSGLCQTQQYSHPKNGYGTIALVEGNFTIEGPAYFHNFWSFDSSTSGAAVYQQTLLNNYSMIGVSGIGADAWSSTPTWTRLDQAYNFALQHNLRFRSNFGPGYVTPNWITGTFPQKRAQYLNRITEILTRYPEVDEWNFCNEITSSTNLNSLLGWTDVEMIVNISQHARHILDSICSDAKLLTNDYSIIGSQPNWPTTHRDAYIQLYVDALAQGAQLDYVGVEGHIFCWANNSPGPIWYNFSDNLQYWRWNAEVIDSLVGLPIVLTEFDISMPWDLNTHSWYLDPNLPFTDPFTGTTYANLWDWQGYAYKAALDTLRAIPNIVNITQAGFDDGEMAWNPWVGLVNAIQLNDPALNPKPAYDSIASILQDEVQLPKARFNILTDATPGGRIFDAGKSSDKNGTITTYNWDFGDGNFGSGSIVSHTYASAGSYMVILTVTDNDNNADTISSTINVCWSIQTQNDTIVQGDSILVHGNYYSSAGVYQILLTDSSGCQVACDSILEMTLHVTLPTNSDNPLNSDVITIFPAPAQTHVCVKGNNIEKITLFSISGKQIAIPVIAEITLHTLHVSSIARGIYFLKVKRADQTTTHKIIIN